MHMWFLSVCVWVLFGLFSFKAVKKDIRRHTFYLTIPDLLIYQF